MPAHEEHKVERALACSAEAIILDLEDAVPEGSKDAARATVARVIERAQSRHGPELWVRVNSADTPHFRADVSEIDWQHTDGAVVSKAERPDAVAALAAASPPRLLLLLETVTGLDRLADLAANAGRAPHVALGTWDLARDLRLPGLDDPDESELVWHVRRNLVLECRRHSLGAPIDGIFGRLEDLSGLEAVCKRVRRLGFGGKLLVHPRQVPVAARVFTPNEDEVREARAIIAAYEEVEREGRGTGTYRGQMIDRVHLERARALIQQWRTGFRRRR